MSVTSSVDATWASANAGLIDVEWGWRVSNSISPLAWQVDTYTTNPGGSWSYSVIASADGVFTLDYSFGATRSNASSFGLTGFTGSGGLGCGSTQAIQGRPARPREWAVTLKRNF